MGICARCLLPVTIEEDSVTKYKMLLHKRCAEFICHRCKLPIRKGTAYVEGKNGRKSHFGCVMSVLGEAVDDGPGIGTPDD